MKVLYICLLLTSCNGHAIIRHETTVPKTFYCRCH